jgi:hypothetical protein
MLIIILAERAGMRLALPFALRWRRFRLDAARLGLRALRLRAILK